MRFATFALAAALLALSTGCKPDLRGAVTPSGYKHNDYGYEVTPLPDGKLMPDGWQLDNFVEKKGKLEPKTGDIYIVEYELDRDGDGEYEHDVDEFTYDLRFKHLKHDGLVFLRTIPISQNLSQKKLSVLMDRYVEQVAGAGYEVVALRSGLFAFEQRYAAAVVAKGPARLAGRDAFVATIDVANLDQIKVDPNARKERVEVAMLHTAFRYTTYENAKDKRIPTHFPVVMFVGYANHPEEFQAGLADYRDFVNRIVVDGKRGFQVAASPEPQAAPPAAVPAAAAAEGEPPKPSEAAPANAAGQ